MFETVNVVAVLVAALLTAAVGSVWYSPLVFGRAWLKAIGRDMDAVFSPQAMRNAVIQGVSAQIIFFFCIAQFQAFHVLNLMSFKMLGLLLILLLVVQILTTVIWEGRSFIYFLITAGYTAVTLFGGMAIIVYWPW